MKLRSLFVCCALVALAGCASTGNGAVRSLTREGAAQAIVIGKTNKDDIRAAFGQGEVSLYANGYEVWLYQFGVVKTVDSLPYLNLVMSSADNKKELSVLFDRAGLVRKYQLMERQPGD